MFDVDSPLKGELTDHIVKRRFADLVVERELGYRYDWPEHSAGHYQHVCPACRRKLLALAQGHLWDAAVPGGSDGR